MEKITVVRRGPRDGGMSYKFQRLREKIRQAVASGDLKGKLPGERELAKRFHVNAKTLSKALTDLAAEGLLHRSIGRGTFVRGSAPVEQTAGGAWLLITDGDLASAAIVRQIQANHSEIHVIDNVSSLRPSFLNQFAAVVDLSPRTPESFMRDLLVRNIPVVIVDREPQTYSTHTVLMDIVLGVAHLTRDLALAGHQRFLSVEAQSQTAISEAIRRSASRYSPDVTVDPCFPKDIVDALEYGATAAICDSAESAAQVMQELNRAGINVPRRISVAAVGCIGDEVPCTGYYVAPRQKAQAIAEILQNNQSGRPTTLWLAGVRMDRGTVTHPDMTQSPPPQAGSQLPSVTM